MVNVYRRGRVYWLRGTIGGRYVRISLKTANRSTAEARAKRLEEGDSLLTLTWADFSKEFLAWIDPHIRPSTRRKYRFVVDRFGRFLKSQGMESMPSVTSAMVAAYIEQRQQDIHPKHGTTPGRGGLRSDLRILRRIFNYARENKYIHENPVRQPKLNYVAAATMPFTDAELAAMFNDPEVREKPTLRALLLTLLYAGFRVSDVIRLERSEVHFDRERIDRKTIKTGAPVSVPIHPDLRVALLEHLAGLNQVQRDSPLLFPTVRGKVDHSLDAKLRRVWKRAGIEKAHIHRFRDTYAVKLLERGASLYDVAKLLGITTAVADRHYAPYVKELQDRGRRLVNELALIPGLAFPGAAPDGRDDSPTRQVWKN